MKLDPETGSNAVAADQLGEGTWRAGGNEKVNISPARLPCSYEMLRQSKGQTNVPFNSVVPTVVYH